MILKKCTKCGKYSLREICNKCKSQTKSAHYKFKKTKDVKQ
ncbi:MAG: nucleolar RNA-binding Nop10p family protein [Nanoarchaeota archaeon]|nr:nucleolar RNA-binding Nop10p family protein [Nanoarchaeota archaeon]